MCYACSDYEYEYPCPDEYPGCLGDCSAFKCAACTDNTLHIREFYMVHDEIWIAATSNEDGTEDEKKARGMLCIGCLEARLGRTLTADDFTDAPVNQGVMMYSERLRSRLNTHV